MERVELVEKLKAVANADTSADPDGWTVENPLWGHCAVIALTAQDIYGGELVRASLRDHPKYAHLRSHYWNRIDGIDVDLTREQYTDLSYTELANEVRSRSSVLAYPDTMRRYKLLQSRLNRP